MKIRLKGSFTVEAVFLYPIIVALVAFMLCICINWYQGISEAAADTEDLVELDTRGNFLAGTSIDSLADTITDRLE
ncbi:MAG: hypothetical protein LUC41_00840 [Clostridiales bacterium]|nr:hypothetical protein [Clostridiales bacterium]